MAIDDQNFTRIAKPVTNDAFMMTDFVKKTKKWEP